MTWLQIDSQRLFCVASLSRNMSASTVVDLLIISCPPVFMAFTVLWWRPTPSSRAWWRGIYRISTTSCEYTNVAQTIFSNSSGIRRFCFDALKKSRTQQNRNVWKSVRRFHIPRLELKVLTSSLPNVVNSPPPLARAINAFKKQENCVCHTKIWPLLLKIISQLILSFNKITLSYKRKIWK